MLTLFEMATLEMWPDIMLNGVDATHPNQQPRINHNPPIAIYFISFIIVGSFFVLNLFVGVTINKFNEMQERQQNRNILLTPEQQQWVAIQKLIAKTRPGW